MERSARKAKSKAAAPFSRLSCDAIIRRAISAIAEEQQSDGGFVSLSSPDSINFGGPLFSYRTTFVTANILLCLNGIAANSGFDPLLEKVRSSAAQFLIREKHPDSSFNYWSRTAPEAKTMPYPDDLDDTFMALRALYGYHPGIINAAALRNVKKLLARSDAGVRGPYRTWLVGPDAGEHWQGVDLGVNSNIGSFLKAVKLGSKEIRQFVEQEVTAGRINSPYYPVGNAVPYFVASYYGRGRLSDRLLKKILEARRVDGGWPNILQTAMGITALLNLDLGIVVRECDIQNFLEGAGATQIDGWKPCAFCVDPARNGKKHYAGSAALTAAFFSEALTRLMEWKKATREKF